MMKQIYPGGHSIIKNMGDRVFPRPFTHGGGGGGTSAGGQSVNGGT